MTIESKSCGKLGRGELASGGKKERERDTQRERERDRQTERERYVRSGRLIAETT